jgi:hypothetical protein
MNGMQKVMTNESFTLWGENTYAKTAQCLLCGWIKNVAHVGNQTHTAAAIAMDHVRTHVTDGIVEPITITAIAIEPPRREATHVFDEVWMFHTYKCRCCDFESFAVSHKDAFVAMDAHHGIPHVDAYYGTLPTDI